MRGYLLRRTLLAPALLLGVLTLTFLLVHAAPGSPFSHEQASGLDPRAADRLRHLFGTEDPLPARYLRWLGAFLTGDLGLSFTYRRPVSQVLAAALPPTLLLAGSALALSLFAGVAGACAAALPRGRALDRAIFWSCATLYAAPPFWTGLLLLMGLSAGLGWLPASGLHDVDAARMGWGAYLADLMRHLALPCVTLGAPGAASLALFLRAEISQALGSEYARAARARGAPRTAVVLRHALRNAAAPAVSLIGLGLPALVGGSLIVEILFAWPGMGRITYEAILARDTPVVAGSVALAAGVTLAASLAADIMLAAADPRVRLGSRPAGPGAPG